MATIFNGPKEIPLPKTSFSNVSEWRKLNKDYEDKLRAWVTARFKDPYAGKIYRIPMADGYAIYMVMTLTPKVKMIHVAIGDAWDHPLAKDVSAKTVRESIDGAERIDKLFAAKRKEAHGN